VGVGVTGGRKVWTRRRSLQPQDQVRVPAERREGRRRHSTALLMKISGFELILFEFFVLVSQQGRRLQGVVDVIGDAVVGVVRPAGVVDGTEVNAGRSVDGSVGVNVFDRTLTLVLLHHRCGVLRPQGDVPLEGHEGWLGKEEAKLIEVPRSTPANDGAGSKVVAEIRMAVQLVVADVADEENDEFVFVGVVAEEDVVEGTLRLRPLGLEVGLGQDHEDPLAGISRHRDGVKDWSA